jgi:hypothetical protein
MMNVSTVGGSAWNVYAPRFVADQGVLGRRRA